MQFFNMIPTTTMLLLLMLVMSKQLTIFSMFLRDNPPCNNSYVDVLNGYMASSPSIGRYCRQTVRQITSQSNHLRIIYHTDPSVARNNRFRFMYRVRTPGRTAYTHGGSAGGLTIPKMCSGRPQYNTIKTFVFAQSGWLLSRIWDAGSSRAGEVAKSCRWLER